MRSSDLLSLLALALVACAKDSDSAALVVQGISVPDFGSWESNRPIEFDFNQPVDFASVSGQSIRIVTSSDVPAVGSFAPKPIDANGDGAPERIDESVVVFHPRCADEADLSDAGLTPGARYLVTLAGMDSGQDPASLLRARSGRRLAQSRVHAFETIADPAGTLYDERPGPPGPIVRPARARTGDGCYLELGGDPAQRVYFELGPASGRPPAGFAAPLNLLGDPGSRVALVLVFDQLIRTTPENLARLRLEYGPDLASPAWTPLESRIELLSNCRPGAAAVRLVPLGAFPPGGFVRAVIGAGFEDLVGEATPVDSAGFALTEVARPAFTSLAPAAAIADEIREEFDFGPESPLSLADPVPLLDVAAPLWGQGELRASAGIIPLPPELREFDWVVRAAEVFELDTRVDTIAGGADGSRTLTQVASGGLVLVRNLMVEPGGVIRVRGPNPLTLHAAGSVTIRGTIDADGLEAQDLTATSAGPATGGAGSAGGGDGASSSASADVRGNAGLGAFGQGAGGGGGGESGRASTTLGEAARRGGGGGGGRFARDRGELVAEGGSDGSPEGTGVESGLSPARGGAPGAEVFTDGDPANDFFGVEPVVDAGGAVVAKRRGELDRVHAGSGGGNGGDSIADDSPTLPTKLEGGGGGGGGGAVVIRATRRIVFGPLGRIHCNGGEGGSRRRSSVGVVGAACGGSGSGGHVILESAEAIDFTFGNPGTPARTWIEAVGGPRVTERPVALGAGGAGGPGVVQLHVPHPERLPGHPASNLILPSAALDDADPLAAVCRPRPSVLYSTVGARSRVLSRWIPLGAAGEESPGRPASAVGMLFGGLETAPGEDQGKVRTSAGRVPELAPLLGPASLAQPGIALLPDGASLALSGAVLAPLRASAEPISPDVYLRTPALLAGFTLRLANAVDPGRREDLTIAAARYDDAAARLTLTAGDLAATLADAIAELGGAQAVELTLVPRFFRVRQGPAGHDLLPDSRFVRILFQGAADDDSGRPDEDDVLVDWTADASAFGALPPGLLDFVRFQVEFELDADGTGFDPDAESLALEFLRLPMRF